MPRSSTSSPAAKTTSPDCVASTAASCRDQGRQHARGERAGAHGARVLDLRQRDAGHHDHGAGERPPRDHGAVIAVEQRREDDSGEDRHLPDAGEQPARARRDREGEWRVEEAEPDRAPAEPGERPRAQRRDHGAHAAARRHDGDEQRERQQVAQARRPLPRAAAHLHAAVEHEARREQQRRAQADAHGLEEPHPPAGRAAGRGDPGGAGRAGGGEERRAQHERSARTLAPAYRSAPGTPRRSGSGLGRIRCQANAPSSSRSPSAMQDPTR
jgi:hypothetical protein